MRTLIALYTTCVLMWGVANAATPLCGSTVTGSIQFTSDMYCGPNQTGLTVVASHVEIDFNGFSMIGPGIMHYTTGIDAFGVDAVTIRGGGKLEGFYWPILIVHGSGHLITGMTVPADWNEPLTLRNTRSSQVTDNTIARLLIAADPGSTAEDNRIMRNRFQGSPMGGSLGIVGQGTSRTLVQANAMNMAGIGLVETGSNDVLGNRITDGWIAMYESSDNRIAGNRISNQPPFGGFEGIWIGGGLNPNCAQARPSSGNLIVGNTIAYSPIAVRFGTTTPCMMGAQNNWIQDNMFARISVAALYFEPSAQNNDARFNQYVSVATQAIDYGTGNLWP